MIKHTCAKIPDGFTIEKGPGGWVGYKITPEHLPFPRELHDLLTYCPWCKENLN